MDGWQYGRAGQSFDRAPTTPSAAPAGDGTAAAADPEPSSSLLIFAMRASRSGVSSGFTYPMRM